MYSPLVSIIIPVYNVEKYLDECLESLKTQTYQNIEVILVDDGSKDRSGEICDGYASKDKKFIAIHQNNAGVSRARNRGLEIANGEWVLFVDSDDKIDTDYVEKYVDSIEDGIDLIYGGYKSFGSNDRGLQGHDFDNIKYNKDNIAESILGLLVYCTPWGRLFRREIISKNKILFEERLSMAEDRLFLYQYLPYVNGVSFINYSGYHYRLVPNSLMGRQHSVNEYLLKFSLLWNAACDIKEKWGLSLTQFIPFYTIHARDIINSLGMDVPTKEKRDLYKNTIGVFFLKEFFGANKKEQSIVRQSIKWDLFYSSFGYCNAMVIRYLQRIITKIKQLMN